MRILENGWKLFSQKEMLNIQENLPENHGWKNRIFTYDFYIIPSTFYQDLEQEQNNILTFNISEHDIETLAEDIANIQLEILLGKTGLE